MSTLETKMGTFHDVSRFYAILGKCMISTHDLSSVQTATLTQMGITSAQVLLVDGLPPNTLGI